MKKVVLGFILAVLLTCMCIPSASFAATGAGSESNQRTISMVAVSAPDYSVGADKDSSAPDIGLYVKINLQITKWNIKSNVKVSDDLGRWAIANCPSAVFDVKIGTAILKTAAV